MTVIDEIAAERRRQVDAEGWTPEHDDTHRDGQLARAAACYAISAGMSDHEKNRDSLFQAAIEFMWPRSWGWGWWKPRHRRRDLIRAGALIVAEVERLDRLRQEGEQ